MLYEYIALAFFAVFALLLPSSFLLVSKLLRRNVPGNAVKNAPYESAEKTIGSSLDLDIEYFPFFMLFLPFEVAAMLVLLWSPSAMSSSALSGELVLLLLVMATALAVFGYFLIGEKRGR